MLDIDPVTKLQLYVCTCNLTAECLIPPKDFSVLVLDADSKKTISLRGYETICVGQVAIASVVSATDMRKRHNYAICTLILYCALPLNGYPCCTGLQPSAILSLFGQHVQVFAFRS